MEAFLAILNLTWVLSHSLEGEEAFEGFQRLLEAVHTLAAERGLSRFMYLASSRPQ